MNFLHVPLHVPREMSRIVDLQFKVRPCWLGHVGTQKPKNDKSFRKSPYNLLSPNICSQHQVPHCHRSQDDFIMSLKIISDIFLDSQSAILLSLDPSYVLSQFAFHPPSRKANMMQLFFVLALVPQQTCSSDDHGSSWGDPCNVVMSHIQICFFQWQGDKMFEGCRFFGDRRFVCIAHCFVMRWTAFCRELRFMCL